MSLHIYRANDQPATRHRVDFFDKPRWITYPQHMLIWACCCDQRRLAKNLIIHVYYDGDRFFCKPNTGCKDPEFIAANKRREFRNRSAGNKLAWQRRKAEQRSMKTGAGNEDLRLESLPRLHGTRRRDRG